MPERLDSFSDGKHTGPMRKWLPLITVSLGTFMLLIDVTIVNVALPDMATDLHSSFSSLQWVIDIYALALAALLLGIGAFSDKVGRRPVYIAGLVVFALSSLSCGLAPDTTVLIVSRGVQGIGAAAMFATTIALLSTSYEGRDRGLAFGVWGAINGAAAAAGPILGGLLTEGLSWRWIFFVNLPISVVAIALSVYALSRDEPRREGRVDLPGMLTFTVSAAAVTYALTRASDAGWGSAQTIGLLALSAVSLLAFGMIETRSRRPLLDLALLRRPRFSAVLVAAFILSLAAFSYLTYISLWLQSVNGMSPIGAGAAFLPLSLASLTVSLTVGRFLHTPTAQRWALTGGLTLIGAGALLAAHLGAGSAGPACSSASSSPGSGSAWWRQRLPPPRSAPSRSSSAGWPRARSTRCASWAMRSESPVSVSCSRAGSGTACRTRRTPPAPAGSRRRSPAARARRCCMLHRLRRTPVSTRRSTPRSPRG